MSTKQMSMFYRQAAGLVLSAIRQEHNLSKQKIYEMTAGEIKISHLSQFERGEKGFSRPKLKQVLDIFGVTIGDFENRVEAMLPEVISGEKKRVFSRVLKNK